MKRIILVTVSIVKLEPEIYQKILFKSKEIN